MQAKRAARDAGRPPCGSPFRIWETAERADGATRRAHGPAWLRSLPASHSGAAPWSANGLCEHTALHGFELARVPQRCGPWRRTVSASTRPCMASSLPASHSGADPWARTVSASTRPCMACSLPASHSGDPILAASRVPLPSTLVTDRSPRPATLSATALRISAAAARADTATVQNVNSAGRAGEPHRSRFRAHDPSLHSGTDL